MPCMSACLISNIRYPKGIGGSCSESRSGGPWSSGVAKEVGVAVVVADEEIKIAVAIGISKGRAGDGANIRYPEGIVFSCGEFGLGAAWSSGIAEEESVAVFIANEEIKITIVIGISQSRAG